MDQLAAGLWILDTGVEDKLDRKIISCPFLVSGQGALCKGIEGICFSNCKVYMKSFVKIQIWIQ